MQYEILDKINSIEDFKKIDIKYYPKLAEEIRAFLVEKVSMTGGHIASNLGIVELTMALVKVLDLPEDKIIFDVGHQSYVYKILTGRKNEFDSLRTKGGLSGFPKRRESEFDSFDTGHSSTSISAALGIAQSYYLDKNDAAVVALIGDGAMTGGLSFEALNNVQKLDRNFIIVLNDNEMSISKNTGGFPNYLTRLRAGKKYNDVKADVVEKLNKLSKGEKIIENIRKTKSSLKQLFVPEMIFENMGITYLGPLDGYDIEELIYIITEAKKMDHPVVLHVITKKGKGYAPAENFPEKFHGIAPFNPETGDVLNKSKNKSYTNVFADALLNVFEKNDDAVAITAAMPDGTGLKKIAKKYPERFFDVGIAEGHAVTFAAGLSVAGKKPFVAIYSAFLQRAYDQILHDVCMQNLPVVFCIDRAGLVGKDGETHQGAFDLSYLSSIPNMNVFVPKNARELKMAVEFASDFDAPLAIRYPRGEAYTGLSDFAEPIAYGKSEIIYKEKDIAIICAGPVIETGNKLRDYFKNSGRNVSLINARFVKPVDEACIKELSADHRFFITIEENVLNGGFGMAVLNCVNQNNLGVKVLPVALPDAFIEQGTQDEQRAVCKIDTDSCIQKIEEFIK